MKEILSVKDFVIGNYYLCYQPENEYEWGHVAYHKYNNEYVGGFKTTLIISYLFRDDGIKTLTVGELDHPDDYLTDSDHHDSAIFELTDDEVLTNIIATTI